VNGVHQCINVRSLNCTRDQASSVVASDMARHGHEDVSQTQAEQRRGTSLAIILMR